jgi:hypothetical protein
MRSARGYVDGMSLYNGYFAQHWGLDPSGTQGIVAVDQKDCGSLVPGTF